MRTTIDAAGRLVVPKALRQRLQLWGGTEVELAEHDGVIELRPAAGAVRVAETEEGPVLEAVDERTPLTDDDVRSALDRVRG